MPVPSLPLTHFPSSFLLLSSTFRRSLAFVSRPTTKERSCPKASVWDIPGRYRTQANTQTWAVLLAINAVVLLRFTKAERFHGEEYHMKFEGRT